MEMVVTMNPIEDYQSAYLQRCQDTTVLHEGQRWLASMHWGGCTVECLLKAIVLSQIPNPEERHWSTKEHPQPHGIKRPGHDLKQALQCHQRLFHRAQQSTIVMKWLNRVQTPSQNFIDLRYEGQDPHETDYQEWWDAYNQLREWLEQQKTQL